MLFALQEWVSLHSWNTHIVITLSASDGSVVRALFSFGDHLLAVVAAAGDGMSKNASLTFYGDVRPAVELWL